MAQEFPQPDVTQEQPVAEPQTATGDAEVSKLPAHLKPEWFDEGAPVPAFMATNENWMNNASVQDETVHVKMGDGSYQKTMYPIHLGVWLMQGGAKIIAEPKEEA